MSEYKDLYDSLYSLLNEYKQTTELKKISDAYKKEFIMFLTICKIQKFDYSYPFFEFDKIINIIQNNDELYKKFLCILERDNIPILFKKNISYNLQDMFIICIKYRFNHDMICKAINYVEINLKFSLVHTKKIKLLNITTIKTLKNDLIHKFNLNVSGHKMFELYKDKKILDEDKKLIEYDIENDDTIDIIINQKS
jgi:hypothetical protein